MWIEPCGNIFRLDWMFIIKHRFWLWLAAANGSFSWTQQLLLASSSHRAEGGRALQLAF